MKRFKKYLRDTNAHIQFTIEGNDGTPSRLEILRGKCSGRLMVHETRCSLTLDLGKAKAIADIPHTDVLILIKALIHASEALKINAVEVAAKCEAAAKSR